MVTHIGGIYLHSAHGSHFPQERNVRCLMLWRKVLWRMHIVKKQIWLQLHLCILEANPVRGTHYTVNISTDMWQCRIRYNFHCNIPRIRSRDRISKKMCVNFAWISALERTHVSDKIHAHFLRYSVSWLYFLIYTLPCEVLPVRPWTLLWRYNKASLGELILLDILCNH